jgi:TetR/AcrR family transcriptional regulator, transcriptional repressor for nem operon
MAMAATKGALTRQRILEQAAPVFNLRGYAGASMRDLTEATGLEKGGIYNHFGSKEALALAAFDHAVSVTGRRLTTARDMAEGARAQLIALVSEFGRWARRPALAGGCPIMNTAIEADDTNPQLREHARNAMNELHRMIGGVVKRGVEANELDASVDPYALASIMTASLEGALMLSKLFDDPVHMERVVEHLTAQIEALPSARAAARTKKGAR